VARKADKYETELHRLGLHEGYKDRSEFGYEVANLEEGCACRTGVGAHALSVSREVVCGGRRFLIESAVWRDVKLDFMTASAGAIRNTFLMLFN